MAVGYAKLIWTTDSGKEVDLMKYTASFEAKEAMLNKTNNLVIDMDVRVPNMHGTDFLDSDGNLKFKTDQVITAYLSNIPIDTTEKVGYWKLDDGGGDTAADSSGNDNDGTIYGATWTTDGKFGNALDFDGTDDYVDLPSDMVDITSDFTVAFWVNVHDFSSENSWQRRMMVLTNGTDVLDLAILNSGSKFTFKMGATEKQTDSTFSTGTLYHFTLVRNSGDYSIFVDGANEALSDGGISANSDDGADAIGRALNSSTARGRFDGIIDDVRIYDRALSASEIENLYVATAPDDLLDVYTITEIDPKINNKGAILKLNCADNTSQILSKSGIKNYPESDSPTIIKKMIDDWAPEVDASYGADGIATTPTDVDSFDEVSYSLVAKPLYEAIDELSQPDMTGEDRPYIYWVDKDNKFRWKYPSTTLDDTWSEHDDDVYEIDVSKKETDETNMVIFNAGKDKNDYSILYYDYNENTRSDRLKMAYHDWSEIATNMQNPGFSWNADGSTVSWDGSIGDTATNEQVRDFAKVVGLSKCETIFSKGGLIWKGNVLKRGNRSNSVGELIKIESETYGLFGESKQMKLRIKDMVHTFDKRGWVTSYSLEEDPIL